MNVENSRTRETVESYPATEDKNRGFAIVTVLFAVAVFFLLIGTLMALTKTERIVSVNEQDHLKALGFAEAGLSWAKRRIADGGDMTDVLNGLDNGSTADDNLIGLRDLTLKATGQFTIANEDTKSAIISKDFTGEGSKNYEVIRIIDDTLVRAHVYVRIEDNYDDDPDDPTNNQPVSDKDQYVKVIAVAEYPVFVDGMGAEQSNPASRGRAQRMLVASFSGGSGKLSAVATNGDIEIGASMKVCGACGSVHSNGDLKRNSGGQICEDSTATGSFSGSCGGVGGDCGGGHPQQPVPIVSVYDDIFVPSIDTFDRSTDTSLPVRMRCPKASNGDPGANKYFALVADNDKGRIFKAYWDFTNSRWTWTQIANLSGSDVILDDCGRVKGKDANYGSDVSDGKSDEFYGWKGDKMEWDSCSSCGSSGGDDSLCTIGNNDYTVNGYYPYGGGAISTSYILPGSFDPDSKADIDPEKEPKTANWTFGSDTVYSPLHGAVIFVYGNMTISGNPGDSSSIDFKCSGGTGCSSGTLPKGLWQVSYIALGDIDLSGQANLGPANPDQDFNFQLVAGRDVMLNGNPQEDTTACSSGCSTSGFSDIKYMGGAYAVHEQLQISGNGNVFGFIIAEDALDCSDTVDGKGQGLTTINGNPQVYYDCQHPPNPWVVVSAIQMATWQEVE